MVPPNIFFHYLTPGHHLQNLRKKFQNIRLDARIQDAAAIFWYPNNMVFRPVYTVSRYSCLHASIIPYRRRSHSPTGLPVELCPTGRLEEGVFSFQEPTDPKSNLTLTRMNLHRCHFQELRITNWKEVMKGREGWFLCGFLFRYFFTVVSGRRNNGRFIESELSSPFSSVPRDSRRGKNTPSKASISSHLRSDTYERDPLMQF